MNPDLVARDAGGKVYTVRYEAVNADVAKRVLERTSSSAGIGSERRPPASNPRRKWLRIPKAAWSWGCVSAIDSNGRTIWIADAHRRDGTRFVVRAEEKLTAFLN